MAAHQALLVVGSGPGIGRNTAAVFAERGFSQVILMSRNAARLSDDAVFVKKAAPSARVDTIPVDLTDLSSVEKALTEAARKLEESKLSLEAVLYNAARVGESRFPQFPAADLEADIRIAVISLYTVAQWSMPRLLKVAPAGQAAFLVTSGLLAKDPFPHLLSLSTSKAAQHSLVHSLYKQYTPQDVHCGLIVVGGFVKDDAKLVTARNVGEEFWRLYEQPKGKWELEVTMLDPDYEAFMKKRKEDSQK